MLVWIGFLCFIGILLALDLGVFHRKAHVISVREALGWTVVWMVTALVFATFVYFGYQNHWLGLGLSLDPVDRAPGFPDGRPNDARLCPLEISHRLRRRAVAQRRQRLRHRDAVRLLRRAAAVSAPRAVLGHPRRSADARHHDRRRRRPGKGVLLDPDGLRRVPDSSRPCGCSSWAPNRAIRPTTSSSGECGASCP